MVLSSGLGVSKGFWGFLGVSGGRLRGLWRSVASVRPLVLLSAQVWRHKQVSVIV